MVTLTSDAGRGGKLGLYFQKLGLERFDLEHVEPVHNHHGFDEVSFEIDVAILLSG